MDGVPVSVTTRRACADLPCLWNEGSSGGGIISIAEVQELALGLPDVERALLASHLLASLPPVLSDEDDGIAEALRRDAEVEANPQIGISLEQLDQQVGFRQP